MKHILIILLCGLLLASCSPQKRLARLVKNHPELVTTDTVTVTLTLPPDTVELTTEVMLGADTAAIRAIRDSIFAMVDASTLNLPATRETVYKYLERVVPNAVTFPADTFRVSEGILELDVWFEGKTLRSRTIKRGEDIEVPVAINTVEPVKYRLKWYWIVILLLAGYMGGRWFATNRWLN